MDRRSAGAESLAVFDQALERRLADSSRTPDIVDRVLRAIREGATTTKAIAEATALATPVVERAIAMLVSDGRVAKRSATPAQAAKPVRKATPRSTGKSRASAG